MPRWISTAQATAFTTLGNSTSMPSPVSLTMRPLCSAILRVDQLVAAGLERGERGGLVDAHEPAVADHVGGQYGGEPSVGVFVSHWHRLFSQATAWPKSY